MTAAVGHADGDRAEIEAGMAASPGQPSATYALDLSDAERMRYRLMAQRARAQEDERWAQFGVVPGARVADVGCGPGAVLIELARAVGPDGHVVGVEPDARARDAAEEEARSAGLTNARVVAGHGEATGLEPASYDVVMMRHVLYHVGARAQAVVAHVATLLRPGGHLYVIDSDSTAMRLTVDEPDLAEQMNRYRDFQRRRGNDVAIGPSLGSLVLGAGLVLVERAAWYNVVPGEALVLGGPPLAAEREMLAHGEATEEDVARWGAARSRVAAAPHAALFVAIFLAVGRRRA